MKKVACRICVLLMLLFVSIGCASLFNTTSAISGKKYSMYAQNDIMFYDPDGGDGNCRWVCGAGDNKDYAGNQIWSDEDLEKIKNYQSIYEEAAKEYNVPWQMLAVIHKIETNLTDTNPPDDGKNLTWQGLYGLYDYAITHNGKVTDAPLFDPGRKLSPEEFLRQSKIAAKTLADYGYDLTTEGGVKKTFFHWNGAAQEYIDKALKMKTKNFTQEDAENGEGSYYVMNKYDAERDPDSDKMDPEWPGMFIKAHVYDPAATTSRYGVYVLYQALTGEGSCKWVCDGGNNGGGCTNNWKENVIYYSQVDDKWNNYNDPKDNYGRNKNFGGCQSIYGYGCGPTSLATIIATMTQDPSVTPLTIADEVVANNKHVCGEGSYHDIAPGIVGKYGLTATEKHSDTTKDDIVNAIKNGSVFHVAGKGASGPFSSSAGHFVAIYDVADNGDWVIWDPGRSEGNGNHYAPDEIYPYFVSYSSPGFYEITCGG